VGSNRLSKTLPTIIGGDEKDPKKYPIGQVNRQEEKEEKQEEKKKREG
jgi:hypothetical protein